MSLPVKLGVGTLALGSIGGVAYAGISYSQQGTEISKLIEEEFQYKLLDTTEGDSNKDKSYWTTNWGNYKTANNGKNKDIFELNGWKSDGSVDLTAKLKEKCSTLKTEKVYSKDDELYKNVTKYCGRYVTVKDEAEKKELKILDTTGDTSKTVWDERNTSKDTLRTDIEKLGMTFEGINSDGIKKGCGTASTNSKKDQKYKSLFKSYEKVCTNPKDST